MSFKLILESVLTQHQRVQLICEAFSQLIQRKYGLDDEVVEAITSALVNKATKAGGPEELVAHDISKSIREMLQKFGMGKTKIYKITNDSAAIKNFAQEMKDAMASAKPEPAPAKKPDPHFPAPMAGESFEVRLDKILS